MKTDYRIKAKPELEALQLAMGIPATAMAAKIGVTPKTYNNVLGGGNVSAAFVAGCLAAFELPMERLFYVTNTATKNQAA